LVATVTVVPPAGDTWFSVTVHTLMPFGIRFTGLQARPDTSTGATRPITAVCALAPSVAVTVAF
jgi:hypothetical protein